MSKEKNIDQCPVCLSSTVNAKTFMVCVDHTVSKKEFSIKECANCSFKFTSPIPLEEEIGEYYKAESYISHSATNKGLINRVYHVVRNYTLKKKRNLVEQYLNSEKSLLDIGCGTGHFLNECKSNGISVLGLEPDPDAREFGIREFDLPVKELGELHNQKEKSFEVITMWHVLEHVYHLNRDFEKINSILKDDGTLIIAVPNCSSFDAKHYKEKWAAYDLPRHLYHFTPADIKMLAERFNMKVEKVLPMKFDSFYVSMLSEKYKGGNLLSAMWNGWRSNAKAGKDRYSSQIYVLKKQN